MSDQGLISPESSAAEPRQAAHPAPVAGSVALRNAGVFLAIVVGGFTVKVLNGILTPLIVAIFMLLLIDGVSRAMERRFPAWPNWLRSALGAGFTVAGFTGVVAVCVHNGGAFATQVKVMQPRIDALLLEATASLQIPPMTVTDLFRGDNPASAVSKVFGAARGVVSEAVLVMIYLGFLSASRSTFGRKAERLFPGRQDRAHAERVFGRVRYASEQYILLQTVKAALVAVTAWGLMMVLGVANPLFIAFVLFLAAFVPIVGSVAGSMLPALMALAQFESPVRPLILMASLGGTMFLIENVLLPKLQSDRLNLDPVFILLSLGFWGIMLGLPGALLSTPLTVVVMSIAAEFKGTRWLAVLLSKDGDLGQRL
ncbi:AI-2E family transporter [Phenylobacterium montanum]|uniref:AI-2E family transporter n=1 Tax=Phenylobacterium montanum TaxID=2823693 RepID=A0A975G167_9CAUL|nr:AI-2E family transporter [Caulobacter sp. S6]QUD88894.1 AI-2E family transporter [Caulobacter sp. S6]